MIKKFALIIILINLMILGCWKSTVFELKQVPETSDFDTQGEFDFSISPSDEFLVYAQQADYDKKEYAIAVLNLLDGSKKSIPVSFETYARFTDNYHECWSQDSSYCVYSQLANRYGEVYPKFIINISDKNSPNLIDQSSYSASPDSYVSYSQIELSGKFTCSDCLSTTGLKYIEQSNAERLLGIKFIAPQHLYRNNEFIMSGDQKYLYYVKKDSRKKAYIMKLDLEPSESEVLDKFSKSFGCIHVDMLSLSPNGKFLAFQVSYGCTLITPSDLYILDILKKETNLVAKNVYSDSIWNSKSDMLYFYSCKVAGKCSSSDGIYYKEII